MSSALSATPPLSVLVVGGVGVDDTAYLCEPLCRGMWTQAARQRRSPAGSALTVAVALASAGVSVTLAGAVGTDADGDWLCQTLAAAGVERRVHRVAGPSPRSLVLVEPSGERTIIGLTSDLLAHATAALPRTGSPVQDANILVVPAWRAQFTDLLCAASAAGVLTVVGLRALADPGVRADIAVGSEGELGDVVPTEIFDRFATVVVTAGELGASVFSAAGRSHVPPLTVQPVDATGAGDAFLAGLVVGLAHGVPTMEALRLAAAWGAAAAATAGTAAPSHGDVAGMVEGQRRDR